MYQSSNVLRCFFLHFSHQSIGLARPPEWGLDTKRCPQHPTMRPRQLCRSDPKTYDH
ncbi:Unknown protein sequence [Pseudomonas syringae pv. cilantro]|uniref:Uncharacterized protein n=2 Tax=Pseudomonas syringae group TaxID=136849 RepID=A0A0N0XB08_PSESX|nr:Unknown protein sequence [Pseudomonas syringae pv. cilantro]KPW77878.1 hypothetical protein ALO76_102173 [Pseudomonas syringae pv. coriandricola]RMN13603.1 hypothetical protein ALQ65_102006 [Pseudomonas syringae pv. coriandricola]